MLYFNSLAPVPPSKWRVHSVQTDTHALDLVGARHYFSAYYYYYFSLLWAYSLSLLYLNKPQSIVFVLFFVTLFSRKSTHTTSRSPNSAMVSSHSISPPQSWSLTFQTQKIIVRKYQKKCSVNTQRKTGLLASNNY